MNLYKSYTLLRWNPVQFRRMLSVNSATSEPNETQPKRRKVKTEPTISPTAKEFEKYFKNERWELLKGLPDKLLKKKQKIPDVLYVAGEDSANIIADTIATNTDDTPIVEVNPGPGIVTEKILNKKPSSLSLIDINELLLNRLEKMHGDKENVSFTRGDFIGLWRLSYLDKNDNGDRLKTLLSTLPNKNPAKDISMKIFAATGSLSFFKHLVVSIANNSSISNHGRYELYAALPPRLYIHLSCNRKAGLYFYRANSVIFQLFFEFKTITKLPRKDFLPWQSKKAPIKYAKDKIIGSTDPDELYLVKIRPRRNLLDFLPQNQLQQFLYFTRQNFASRKARVIPSLEHWIPGIGKRLILLKPSSRSQRIIETNYPLPDFCSNCYELATDDYYPHLNIYTEFGDLSPNQMLSLFFVFRNSPEFEESSFLSHMETTMLKQTTEESINEIEQPLVEEIEEK